MQTTESKNIVIITVQQSHDDVMVKLASWLCDQHHCFGPCVTQDRLLLA